jgi:hypothetical protein
MLFECLCEIALGLITLLLVSLSGFRLAQLTALVPLVLIAQLSTQRRAFARAWGWSDGGGRGAASHVHGDGSCCSGQHGQWCARSAAGRRIPGNRRRCIATRTVIVALAQWRCIACACRLVSLHVHGGSAAAARGVQLLGVGGWMWLLLPADSAQVVEHHA